MLTRVLSSLADSHGGRAGLSQIVDAAEDLFIEKIAKYRGTTIDRVVSDFGQGATLPASKALGASMFDGYSNLEDLLRSAA